jgi:hypothetical protein
MRLLLGICLFLALAAPARAQATFQTRNFTVTAHSQEFARSCAEAAEGYRKSHAIEWLGHELPPWNRPCPIHVNCGQIGCGGFTKFKFADGQVFKWDMQVQGSEDRILDSVIPHEVLHTVFASHFRRPLPRWADEGACTTVEEKSERLRLRETLHQAVTGDKMIPLAKLFPIQEYPADGQETLALYAEGWGVSQYLIELKGKAVFLNMLERSADGDWNGSVRACYGFADVADLELHWGDWLYSGKLAESLANYQPAPPQIVPVRPTMLVFSPTTWFCFPCSIWHGLYDHDTRFRHAVDDLVTVLPVDSATRPDMVQKYGIQVVPTFVIIRADGTIAAKQTGYCGSCRLLAFIRSALVSSPGGAATPQATPTLPPAAPPSSPPAAVVPSPLLPPATVPPPPPDMPPVPAPVVPGLPGKDGRDGKDGLNGKDGKDGAPAASADLTAVNQQIVTLQQQLAALKADVPTQIQTAVKNMAGNIQFKVKVDPTTGKPVVVPGSMSTSPSTGTTTPKGP